MLAKALLFVQEVWIDEQFRVPIPQTQALSDFTRSPKPAYGYTRTDFRTQETGEASAEVRGRRVFNMFDSVFAFFMIPLLPPLRKPRLIGTVSRSSSHSTNFVFSRSDCNPVFQANKRQTRRRAKLKKAKEANVHAHCTKKLNKANNTNLKLGERITGLEATLTELRSTPKKLADLPASTHGDDQCGSILHVADPNRRKGQVVNGEERPSRKSHSMGRNSGQAESRGAKFKNRGAEFEAADRSDHSFADPGNREQTA